MSGDAMLAHMFDDYLREAGPEWRQPFDKLLNLVSEKLDQTATSEQVVRDQAYDIIYDHLRETQPSNYWDLTLVLNGWHANVPIFA